MSETKDTDEQRPKLGGKTLSLRRSVESSHVRQNFSHGRSKAVLVEKKRKRTVTAPGTVKEAPAEPEKTATTAEAKAATPDAASATAEDRAGVVLRSLTDEEKDARAQALVEAREREAEERKIAEQQAVLRREEEARKSEEEREAEARREEEEARRKLEEEAREKAAEEAGKRLEEAADPTEKPADAEVARRPEAKKSRKGRGADTRPSPGKRDQTQRRRGKLTIANALDDTPRQRSISAMRRQREREKKQAAGPVELPAKIAREVTIPEAITIQELANRMAERAVDVIKLLMQQGQMMKINDILDADTAQLLVEELGHIPKRVSEADVEEGLMGDEDGV